jgi:hypothetical protein
VVESHAALARKVDEPTSWKTVGRTFTFRRIEGPIRRPDARTRVCTMVLYVATGRNTYRSYALSGGP